MIQTPLIIAEVGSCHDGSFGNAGNLIRLAASCGADAVKFQTHIAQAESTPNAPSPSYFSSEDRMTYFRRTAFSRDQWKQLAEIARENDILFLSSPFSLEAIDLLESINMVAYKVPSGEVTNIPLLERLNEIGKPVLLSSGMSNFDEINTAVSCLSSVPQLSIMQCTSIYPCPVESIGLNIISEIKQKYPEAIPGFSDHSLGIAAPLAAAASGARIIEKHFTFSRYMYGSDAQNSMEPGTFTELIKAIKDIWSMMEHPVDKDKLADSLNDMKEVFEKSIVASRSLPAGHVIDRSDMAFRKPGTGISASDYKSLIGKVLSTSVSENHQFTYEDIK